MTVTQTTTISNSIQAKWQADFILSQKPLLYYDQISYNVNKAEGTVRRGSSINIPFYFELEPAVTPVPQTSDITPVVPADSYFTVTPDLYGNAVQLGRKAKLTAYTDVEKVCAELVGRNCAVSRDYMARTKLTQGSFVIYAGSATSRATLDYNNDQVAYGDFLTAATILSNWEVEKVGGNYMGVTDHSVLKDMVEDGTIILIAEYQKGEILLNGELGMVAGVKLVVTPFAKKFWGSGTSAATVSNTVATAVKPGDKTIVMNAAGTAAAKQWLTIGSVESSTTEYENTERVYVVSIDTATITIIGAGPNGGCKYNHAVGATIKDNDTVHTVAVYGQNSLGKYYDDEDGPNGRVLPPKVTGLLDQFDVSAWRGFWGWGLTAENRVVRIECAASAHL